MIQMKVTGANELMAKFEKIKAAMYKGFAAALVAGAFPVSNDAKRLAPKLSGNLARSIHIATKKADITMPQPKSDGLTIKHTEASLAGREIDSIASKLRSKGKAEVLVGTNVVYARVQEYTAAHHKIGTSPYLRPALDNNKAEVKAEIQRAVKMIIDKAEARK